MTQARSGVEILAEVIRRYYDLGTVELPQQLGDAHQRRHRKLVVNTSAGKFLVKTYKNDPVILDALRFQHRLSDHLTEHAVPVARIQRAKDGKGIVEFETWALELQEFANAEPMEMSVKRLVIAADTLGKFHQVGRDFPCPARDTRMWRFSEVPRSAFAQLYELAKAQGHVAEATDCCNTIALFLHEATKKLDWDARGNFETGLIHGDYHAGNLLFNGDTLVAIVDLEFAGSGCYLEDLAYATSNLCIRTATEPDRLEGRVNILLDYYQIHRTLSIEERVALYYAIGVKHVATVSYQITQLGGMLAGLTAMEWMARLSEQCVWLAERARAKR